MNGTRLVGCDVTVVGKQGRMDIVNMYIYIYILSDFGAYRITANIEANIRVL